jgi:hypothetical protein
MMPKTYENRFNKYPVHENQGAKVPNFEKGKYKRQTTRRKNCNNYI